MGENLALHICSEEHPPNQDEYSCFYRRKHSEKKNMPKPRVITRGVRNMCCVGPCSWQSGISQAVKQRVGSVHGDEALHGHEQQPHLKTNVNNTRSRACYKRYFHMVCLGQTAQMDPLPLSSLLPPEEDLGRYYRYKGSLTTPDCHEGVIWTVFEKPIELSISQVSRRGIAWKVCLWLFCPFVCLLTHTTHTC